MLIYFSGAFRLLTRDQDRLKSRPTLTEERQLELIQIWDTGSIKSATNNIMGMRTFQQEGDENAHIIRFYRGGRKC
jgi:hypothetical protein